MYLVGMSTALSTTQEFIDQNRDRFLAELLDWLKIPSVSADPAFKEDVQRAANFLLEKLKEAGADNVTLHPTAGHPIVYGDKFISEDLPTVLVYGHYDVQPPDPIELWTNPPFEPTIKKTAKHPDGAIFARGACDDKGQAFMHVKAFEAMMQAGDLPCNLKFLIEGEEEVGSANLDTFVKSNLELLACDVVLISDTSIIANDVPSLTVGLRGMSYVEVKVTGPNRDLHSGVYGGAVANPINVLCDMIASMHDETGRITIPGFYDRVQGLSPAERDALNEAPFDHEAYKKDLEIGEIGGGEKSFTPLERTSIRPTLDVNGIWGGYIGKGAKTVLPSEAFAKISMRLVPDQTPEATTRLFKEHFEAIAPPSVKVEVTPHHGGHPAVLPTDSDEYRAASRALAKTFGKEPIPARGGGSIPIVSLFEKELSVKCVLMGFGLNSDDIHSPDEHYGLFNFYKGIETIPHFYREYAAIKKGA
jgi:acetylornithine deacetylase/succinyl-diaminopimelate desuccinylase-like protein